MCSQGSSATPRPHLATQAASSLLRSPGGEIELISNDAMHRVSEIKLIRTDTTLDLSLAEMVGLIPVQPTGQFYPANQQ